MKTLSTVVCTLVLAAFISLSGLFWTSPAMAASSPRATDGSLSELQTALEQTKDPQRLVELQQLQQALASSDDRAQVSNESSHQLGIFARYKKDAADSEAQFFVLGAGHETDDDYDIIGVYVPAQVGLIWSDGGSAKSTQTARVLTVLDGEQLSISDPPGDASTDQSVNYALSLPAFNVGTSSASITTIPQLSQAELDETPESAPLD
jgi:hypothetical protein